MYSERAEFWWVYWYGVSLPLHHLPMGLMSYVFTGYRRFITVLTKARHWNLFWASRVQFTPLVSICLGSILMLSSHLTIFGEEYRLWSSSLCNFLRGPSSSVFGPNILLNTLFSETVCLCPSKWVHRPKYQCPLDAYHEFCICIPIPLSLGVSSS
jgi:hypothetical protein